MSPQRPLPRAILVLLATLTLSAHSALALRQADVSLVPQIVPDPGPLPSCQPSLPPANLTGAPGVFPLLATSIALLTGSSITQQVVFLDAVGLANYDAFTAYTPNLKPYVTLPDTPCLDKCAGPNPMANMYQAMIAQSFAILRVHELLAFFPQGTAMLSQQVAATIAGTGLTLDSGRECADLSTHVDCTSPTAPACIGTKVAFIMYRKALASGWNVDGSLSGDGVPFADYTGAYKPRNRFDRLYRPTKWQPMYNTDGRGYFSEQQMDSPNAVSAKASFLDAAQVAARKAAPPKISKKKFRALVNQAVNISANLDDRSKTLAEYFALAPLVILSNMPVFAQVYNWTYSKQQAFLIGAGLIHDTHIIALREKIKYDFVRPMTAVRYFYGKTLIKGYAGFRAGGVKEIMGDQWVSYLPTPAEPEYPSGGACYCTVLAQWVQLFLTGTDDLHAPIVPPLSYSVLPGCSRREPGLSPSVKMEGGFATGAAFLEGCKLGRMQAGIHFRVAVDASEHLCAGIAKIAYDKLVHASGAF